jgi:hypothetical protein
MLVTRGLRVRVLVGAGTGMGQLGDTRGLPVQYPTYSLLRYDDFLLLSVMNTIDCCLNRWNVLSRRLQVAVMLSHHYSHTGITGGQCLSSLAT